MLRSTVSFALVCEFATAGCGRFGFDVSGPDGGIADGDSTIDSRIDSRPLDAAPTVRPCGSKTNAPNQLTISGSTFQFTSFLNTRGPITTTTITAFDTNNNQLAQSNSDTSGNYFMVINTAGLAPKVKLRFDAPGWFPTTVHTDTGLDQAVIATGAGPSLLAFGDGPLWDSGVMMTLYNQVGVTLRSDRTSLTLVAVDCSGQPLPKVRFNITPAPEKMGYAGTSGAIDNAVTSTVDPNALALAYNALPGVVRISATKTGSVFAEQQIELVAGQFNTIVFFRPAQLAQ
jgi:hypothetical protein